jgi:class 3 adenylate cyclase/tetratricopeptide (TPR) repeat protein
MQCPRCHHENPGDAKFCLECGRRLAVSCGACGMELPAGAKFCKDCGQAVGAATSPTAARVGAPPESYTPKHLAEKILTSKAALEGERKQVTVLFADLKGSMELLADRDPEEARKILDPVLERMMEAVHRYEGTVNQVMGDGIMALFGAPLAHEDHAVRACYAALRMQEAVKRYAESIKRTERIPVSIRVGLNSGEVVVRSIGSDLRMDYTAVGQSTHLAARMEQTAIPETILITSQTLSLAEGYVDVKSLGHVPIKGLSAPIEIYELLGARAVRSRLQAGTRGLTRFVGRLSELEQLQQVLNQAHQGHGQVLAIIGEPGVGKSRLLYEFTHSHRVRGWLSLQAGAVAYGRSTSYLPVADLLKEYFQIVVSDEPHGIREKVTSKLLSLDEALLPTLPTFLALLDVVVDDPEWQALDPSQRQQLTREAVRRLFLRESQARPLLLVLEDLQWIDAETQVLLDGLVESLAAARLLLLLSYRPEHRHAWGSKTYYMQLPIGPLTPASAGEMLMALVGADRSLEPLKPVLIDRTDGNPFFIEETVRTLVETGTLTGDPGAYHATKSVVDVRVPAKVEAVLAARIDRLPPEDKRLLQSAAVVGNDVPLTILQEIAEASLDELRLGLERLQTSEFLYEVRIFPDLEYAFKHALTHEVVYAGLPQARRRALHAQVLSVLESLFADRLEGQLERLAHHAWHGEMWNSAVLLYARRAGAKAEARSANREAVACFEQAIAALRRVPETRESITQAVELRFELRNALLPLGEFEAIREHLRTAEELARILDDQQLLGRVAAYQTDCLRLVGDSERAIKSGQRALVIADACGDFSVRVLANTYLGQVYQSGGDYSRAVALFRSNVEALVGPLARERFGVLQLPSVHSRTCLVWCLAELGAFEEGVTRGEEAIRIAESVQHPMNVMIACSGLGSVYLRRGDLGYAIPVLKRALDVSRLWNIPLWFPRVASDLGAAYALSGRVADALPLLEHAVEGASAMRLRGGQSLSLTALSHGYLLAGRIGDALDVAQRAVTLAREHGERGHEAWALRLLGEIALQSTPLDHAVAEQYLKEALALARQLAMRPLEAYCFLGLGELAASAGKRAEGYLTAALTLFVELGMRGAAEEAEAALKSGPGL